MTSDKSYTTEQRLNLLIQQGVPISTMLTSNAPQASSTTQISTGLSLPMISGVTYLIVVDCGVSCDTTGGRMYLSLAGPTTSYFHATVKWAQLFSTVVATAEHVSTTQSTMGNNSLPGPVASNTTAAGGSYYWFHLQGRVIPSNNTSLQLNAATSGAGAFTVQQDSMMILYPQG